ncbi:MAG: hypothetical protein Q9161_000037 [Pseudevernia consocians]
MRNVAFSATRKRVAWKDLNRCPYSLADTRPNAYLYHHRSSWGIAPKIQYCGAKSRATISLDDLPQNTFTADHIIPETENVGPAYPTVVQQARNNMRKFDKCVLLTRVGSFYELYFEHAEKYGPLLNIKVAQKKTAAGSVPMAGFPFYQLDRFLKILVQDLNEFVAISEEFANDASGTIKSGGLLFDRRVTRTITPGTLIDEKFMDPYDNNFLLALHAPGLSNSPYPSEIETIPAELAKGSIPPSLMSTSIGLAWLDLSTGSFSTQITTIGSLASAAARIGPREIVLGDDLEDGMKQSIMGILEQQRHLVTYHSAPVHPLSTSFWTPMLEAEVPMEMQSTFTNEELAAGSLLLAYVKERLQGSGIKLQPPVRRQDKETMSIDKNSMRALEILKTSKGGKDGDKGSLLHTMRRTVTKSGARLLREWIASPSMSLQVINARLDIVTLFLRDRALREDITSLLRRSYDSERLVQKFSMGRGDADDLISLLRTIEATSEIASLLETHSTFSEAGYKTDSLDRKHRQSLQNLSCRLWLEEPKALAARIADAIDEDGVTESHRIEETKNADIVSMAQGVLQKEGSSDDQAAMTRLSRSKVKQKPSTDQEWEEEDVWVLRKNASPILESLHEALDGMRQDKASLTSRLSENMNTPSLTLRCTPGLGHHCHVKGLRDVAASLKKYVAARDVKSTKSTRSFHDSEWSSLGSKIDQAKLRIKAEEQRVFQLLREQVVVNLVKLRRNAAVLDELDIGCSFATSAEEQGFVRPVLDSSLDHKIIGGRHPTVKLGLEEQGRAFVSNDCSVGVEERIWLITGPNMAGKSTFLRQNALICVLAQVGSFVPAEHAEIGLVDQIFTRVGSADDLFRDQSTFMVEMMETAAILNQATAQSFVIMDEIGRGTTPEDGIAMGFACLHHLYYRNLCRTLFATHFHALADMTKEFEHLACYCTDVVEGSEGSFSFVHRLRKGVNRSSHALKVARLAGMILWAPAIPNGWILTVFRNSRSSD